MSSFIDDFKFFPSIKIASSCFECRYHVY